MKNEYYYNESIARFYDAVYEKIPHLNEGIDFYLNEINNTNGKVLEAGVGTGRIFVPALNSGADIYGIDYSENMLAKLKEKIPQNEQCRVTVNDIRDFKIDQNFSLVISPFRVFQHLLTIEDQLNALNAVYDHLEPGGKLIFDMFNPDLRRITNPVDNLLEFDGEYESGRKLQRYASIQYDTINQMLDLTFKFVWDENGTEKTDTFSTPLRYFFRYELENLIGRTKFKLENIYGSFNKDELNNNSKELIVICRK